MVIIEQDLEDSNYCLLTKGAPERIWKMCNQIYNHGKFEEINDDWNH